MDQTQISDSSAHTAWSVEKPEKDWRTLLGVAISIIWLLFLFSYIAAAVGWGNVFDLKIEVLGSFLEGAFAPLAFLWFVLAYYSQQKELSQNTEAIKMQHSEIQKSAEQAVIQARAIQASELHARRESFLSVAASVKQQLGAILGFLYLSSQGQTGTGSVESDKLSKLWHDMGTDSEIFARQILELSYPREPEFSYKLFFGTPVRTRHSENFLFNFNRMLDAAEECDTNGMIRDALLGSAFGHASQRIESIKNDIPAGFKYGEYDFDPDEGMYSPKET